MKIDKMIIEVSRIINTLFDSKRVKLEKLVHKICVESSQQKLVDTFLKLPQEEREKLFMDSF